MNKALDFLEQHCQWIAIGLGSLFLAWTLYAYVLVAPVAVTVGGKTYTPGDVDLTVKTTVADGLQMAMNSETPETPPTGQVPELTMFVPKVKEATAPALPIAWSGSLPKEMSVNSIAGPDLAQQMVKSLPVTPPSEPLEIKSARVYHGDPLPIGAPAPQPPQPGQAVAGHDLSYVRLSYKISPEDIVKEYEKVKVSPNTQTGVEAIKLMRQEQDANGNWGTPVEVKFINNGAPPLPLPDKDFSSPEMQTFRTVVEGVEGQMQLLRPNFYPVIFGEGPWDPSSDDALPKYDPVAEAAAIKKANDDKKAADLAAAAAKKAAARPSGPSGGAPSGEPEPGGGGPPPGPRGGGGGRGGRGGRAAVDPQRPADLGDLAGAQLAQAGRPGIQGRPGVPPGYPPQGYPGGPGGPGGPPPFPGNIPPDGIDMNPNAAPVPGAGMPNAGPLPAPAFSPAVTPAFIGWIYDETVTEGHTYRYQVLYALRNPVGGTVNMADTTVKLPDGKLLTEEAVIWSELSDTAWSQPIEVKPTAEFYLAQNNWQTAGATPNLITVNVFKWAKGKWQKGNFKVSPGDKIGFSDNGIDYSTNTMVVDIRFDTRVGQYGRAYVLLLTDDGRLIERQPTVDRANPRPHQLDMAIQQAAQPAAGQPGAPPGAPGSPVTPPAGANAGGGDPRGT